ncbi:hypothetical protein VTK73DRAFT_10112 [Phialemonium thermophilum]|uniref:Uncharacterized protein n=1 Tax=Phialemonium thermophilum TaxID=223376 RepID=A0ABR3XHB9_9PEZI
MYGRFHESVFYSFLLQASSKSYSHRHPFAKAWVDVGFARWVQPEIPTAEKGHIHYNSSLAQSQQALGFVMVAHGRRRLRTLVASRGWETPKHAT